MSDQSNIRKFLFDHAFDDLACGPAGVHEKIKQTYTEEQLEAAKKECYDQGVMAGKQSAIESQQQAANILLSGIEGRLTQLMRDSSAIWQQQLQHMQSLALVIARKIMPTYIATHGLDEIETIVGKTVTEMSREPRLVIRVPESLFDDASTRINSIAEKQAYAGKVVILGDPELDLSDCRIEWADGGIERDIKTLWEDIDKIMEEVQSTPDLVNPPKAEAAEPTSQPQTDSGATT